jgi:hypothetical protein
MFYTNILVCCGIGTSLWPSTGRGSRNEMQGRQWCRASGCRAKTLWTSTENSTIHHNSSQYFTIPNCQNGSKYDKMLNLETVTWSRPISRYISDHLGPRLGLILLNWRPPDGRKVDQVIWISPCSQHDGNSVTIGYLCLQKEVENSRDTKTVLYCFDCSLWVLIMRYLRSSIVPKYLFTVMPGIRQ